MKSFYSAAVGINETEKIDELFAQVNVIDFIETKQKQFDFEESEFADGKVNFALPQNKTRTHS